MVVLLLLILLMHPPSPPLLPPPPWLLVWLRERESRALRYLEPLGGMPYRGRGGGGGEGGGGGGLGGIEVGGRLPPTLCPAVPTIPTVWGGREAATGTSPVALYIPLLHPHTLPCDGISPVGVAYSGVVQKDPVRGGCPHATVRPATKVIGCAVRRVVLLEGCGWPSSRRGHKVLVLISHSGQLSKSAAIERRCRANKTLRWIYTGRGKKKGWRVRCDRRGSTTNFDTPGVPH